MAPFRPPLLHDHVDGCDLLLPILPRLFELSGKSFPFDGERYPEQVRKIFCDSSVDIVERFSNTTGVMQSPEALELSGYAYTTGRAKQGYKYCEGTIAPQYHTFGGLKPEEVIAAFIAGIKRGEIEYPDIEVNILFTIGRETQPENAVRLVNAASRCDRDYVVGIGLVCDENFHPPIKHTAMFRHAKELGFKTTCHAGEWISEKGHIYHCFGETQAESYAAEREKFISLENIATALFVLKVDRIGHAIPLAYNSELVNYAVKNRIGVEWCPGSNLVSELIPNTRYLQIRNLLRRGVLGSLNPDDDLFLPDMDKTFTICNSEYHFSKEELRKLTHNAWKTRFGNRKPERPATLTKR